MRAVLRWIRSDLRAHPCQVLVELLVVGGVLTALLLSVTVLEGATNPWRGLFAQSRGARIWMHLAREQHETRKTLRTQVTDLRHIAGVTAAAGPYATTAATIVQGPVQSAVELRAMTPRMPQLGRLLVREGSWLRNSAPRGVVLEASFAQAIHVTVGSWLVINGIDGPTARVRVIGIAATSDQGFYPDQTPGLAWVQLPLLRQVEPISWHTEEVVGLRVADPADTSVVVQQGVAELGGAVLNVSTWNQVQQSMARGDPLLGLLLALFGLVALGGAVLVIASASGGRVLMQLADLATLKTLGFTPGQITAMVVAEHAAVGLVGTGLGLVATRELTFPLLRGIPPTVVPAVVPLPVLWFLAIAGLAVSMAVITIGLGVASTVDEIQRHPADIGLAAALTVSPGELSQAQAAGIVAGDRQIAHAYKSVQVTALLASGQTTITTLGLGYSARPYPFPVAQGSLYHLPGQAVASEGLLDLLHLKVGDFVPMQINGVPVIFHIVGRIVEPEYSGQVLAYGLDTLDQAGVVSPPVYDSLVLRPGVTASAARTHLLALSRGRLDVAEITDPASPLGIIRPMLTGLIAVLALVGLASVLTASAVGIRDQLRDVGALRAIGLTPRQVMISLISSTAALAVIGIVAGATAGLLASTRLINLGAQVYGIGSGIGRPPSLLAMAVVILIAVAGATLIAIVPARRIATIPVAAMLGP